MTLRCDLCSQDCTGHAVVDGLATLCPPCAHPPTLTTLQLVCLVAAGAIAVVVMVAGIVAIASVMT